MKILDRLFRRLRVRIVDVISIEIPPGYVYITMTTAQFDDWLESCKICIGYHIDSTYIDIMRKDNKRYYVIAGSVMEEILDNEPRQKEIPSYM